MKIFRKIFFSAFGLFLVLFLIARAADENVSFSTAVLKIAPGSDFKVAVFLGSAHPVNAIDLQINYSTDLADFLGFADNGSVVNFWQSKGIKADGTIVLVGGMTKPFNGENGSIINLLFHAKQDGNFKVGLTNGNLYLANGQGTAVSLVPSSLALAVSESGQKISFQAIPDSSPPDLTAEIAAEPIANQSLVVFQATDNESGINFVQMRSKNWFGWTDWQLVQTPIVPPSHAWLLELQAVNGAGLTSTKLIYFWPEILSRVLVLVVFIFILVCCALFYNRYRRRK